MISLAPWQVSSEVVVPSGSRSDCFFSLHGSQREPQTCFLYSRACQCASLLVLMGQNGHFSPQFE